MKILIAEDNPDNLDMLTRRLQRKGHDVEAVTDGLQAVEAVSSARPDLVIMDVSMPVMSGLEATAKIRALDGAAATTPIIALTAHAMESDKARCLAAGCTAYATKPVDFRNLMNLIDEHAAA